MRDEPGKGCRIYRLYFSEEDPSDVALRRWIWSLPSRKRGHIIKSILRKQLADWGRMKSRGGRRQLRQIQRSVSPGSLLAKERGTPIGATDQIQSMINRAFASKDYVP
jgi:hypothetical protein